MARSTRFILAMVAVITAGYIAASPYLAVSAMRDAAIAGDAAGVAEHVDFPAVKDSVKANLGAAAMKSAGDSNEENPLASAGAMFAMAFIGPMVDAMVSPEGLALLIRQGRLIDDRGPAEDARDGKDDTADEVDAGMRYRDFNTFVVTLRNAKTGEEPMGLIFKRHGITSWKLTSLELPM